MQRLIGEPDTEAKLASLIPDAVPDTIPTAAALLQQPASAVGFKIKHMWSEGGQDLWYGGKILKVKKNFRFQISYWNIQEEQEEDSVDYDIPVKQLVVDLLLGDIIVLV